MTMRHIKPHSAEWHEVMESDAQGLEVLDADQVVKLRQILAMERATLGMPPVDLGTRALST